MGMNGIQMGTLEIHTSQDQIGANMALVAEQHLLKQAIGGGYLLLSIRVKPKNINRYVCM